VQFAFYMLLNVCITYTGPLSVQAQYSRSCSIIRSFCFNSSLVTWTVVCMTAAKFKPLIFPVSLFWYDSVLYYLYSLEGKSIENTVSSIVVFTWPLHNNGSYSIVSCVFVAAGICLPSRSLATGLLVTIYKFLKPQFIQVTFMKLFHISKKTHCVFSMKTINAV
jgi:hypothetical protein